jgi:hypothetical protein
MPKMRHPIARSPQFFWHNIGFRTSAGARFTADQKNEWWQHLLREGELPAGFDNQPGDHGDKLLNSYIPGDRIVAYAGGYGAVGWGVVENPSYKLIEKRDNPFLNGGWRHRLKGITWKEHAKKVEDALRAKTFEREFGVFHPLATKVNIDVRKAERLIQALKRKFGRASTEYGHTQISEWPKIPEREQRLLEDAYLRASPATLKKIIPRHNKLSNRLCEWLHDNHGIFPIQEQNHVDIHFRFEKQRVLAELKVCYGKGIDTRNSIREALGQLLEYNHYPTRPTYDLWLVVLDTKPSTKDRGFVENLRKRLSLPLSIGWKTQRGFSFQPNWLSNPNSKHTKRA